MGAYLPPGAHSAGSSHVESEEWGKLRGTRATVVADDADGADAASERQTRAFDFMIFKGHQPRAASATPERRRSTSTALRNEASSNFP